MVRIEVTIISSALRLVSFGFFVVQLVINLLSIGKSGPLVFVPILTALVIGLAGWGLAIVIDLLAGIESALKKRNEVKPKVEDWQAMLQRENMRNNS